MNAHAGTSIAAATDYIAGEKRAADWAKDRLSVAVGGEPSAWRKLFEDYFLTRLNLRYLEPIGTLQNKGKLQGEGFSIVAIQCSLIEFLESTVQGITYKRKTRGVTLGQYEYFSSSEVFQTFLTTRAPFAAEFTDQALAEDFYDGVRCALLHEARTRNGWRIRAKDPSGRGRIIDRPGKLIFRNSFQQALLTFISEYGEQLTHDAQYQAAFIRKFDSLVA